MESYARGPAFALTTKTTPQVLADTVDKFPDREALVVPHQKIRLTWKQLADEVEKTARGLTGLGLSPGDRVGVWATNCAEWLYLQLGCARAGLVLVNVNPAYRALELAYVLKRSGIKALFLRCEDARSKYREILEQATRGEILALEHVVYQGDESWDSMIANGIDIAVLDATCHDLLNIHYTYGTT
jgi:fatty-acyl-CoA synthase